MGVDEAIDLLEERTLLSAVQARQLRKRRSERDPSVTLDMILKVLVEQRVISRLQAESLHRELADDGSPPPQDDEELGLAALDDDEPSDVIVPVPAVLQPSSPAGPRGAAADDDLELQLAGDEAASPDDVVDLEPLRAPGEQRPPRPAPPKAAGKPLGDPPVDVGKLKLGDARPARPASEWESPLIVYGVGGLTLLAGVGALLWFLLLRENADALLAQANEFYDGGSYTQAEKQYQRFVESFASHPDHSFAKVRLGLAKLRHDVEGSPPLAALATAQQVIPQIEDEPAFAAEEDQEGLSQAKRELSALLTRIATSLAEQADVAADEAAIAPLAAALETTLGLTGNTKYVPQRYRLQSELDAARATLQRVEQRRGRAADLAQALAAMDEAIAAGDFAAALASRRTLLEQHPVLSDDEQLLNRIRQASAAEQARVKWVAATGGPRDQPPPSPVVAELTLAERLVAPASGRAAAEPTTVVVDGSLYAFRCDDGSLLWRRRLGGAVQPLRLAEGVVVAVAADRRELICLDGATGAPRWQTPIDDELTSPVADDRRLYLGGRSGRLYIVDVASGKLQGHFEFSQPIDVPPAIDARRRRCYVVGRQAQVYSLSTDDLSCLAAYFLGHAAGAVATPPVALGDKLLVAENAGEETSYLRVLGLDDHGAAARTIVSPRLAGLILTPLSLEGRRAAVVTTHGAISVFDVGTGEEKSAVAVVAARDPQTGEAINRFALLSEGRLWVGGDQLAKLQLLPADGSLSAESLDRNFQGDLFDAPLQRVGDVVVSVRRPPSGGGAIVAGTDPAANRGIWETRVAVPPAGAPAIDPRGPRIAVALANGAIHLLDRDALAGRRDEQALRPDVPPAWKAPADGALDLGAGRLFVSSAGSAEGLWLDPDARAVRVLPLPGPRAGAPVVWGESLVVACDNGPVQAFAVATGEPQGAPFVPPLIPGKTWRWLRGAVVGGGGEGRLAVTDGVERILLLERRAEPTPQLAEVASAEVGPQSLTTHLAAASSAVFAAAGDMLLAWRGDELQRSEPLPLGGKVTWGPFAAGAGVLVEIAGRELAFVSSDLQIAWRRPLARGALGGTPLVEGDAVLLLEVQGAIGQRSLADGAETASLDLGQPVVAGPAPLGPRVVVAAADGALLVVNRPGAAAP